MTIGTLLAIIGAAMAIALAGVEIDDPRWREAQRAIKDSLTATGSVTYFRAYRRADADKPWEQIPLDFSAIVPSELRPAAPEASL